VTHEGVRVSQRCNANPHEVSYAKNKGCVLKKVASSEQRQPKRKAIWATASKVRGVRLPKSFRAKV
jgi:hypothetical protein